VCVCVYVYVYVCIWIANMDTKYRIHIQTSNI